MNLKIDCLFNADKISISEFTLEDFRSISFMLENDMDDAIYEFLEAKMVGKSSAVDKFNLLLEARSKFVSDTITLNNRAHNITINLKMWKDTFRGNVKNIRKMVKIENFELTLDYPDALYFKNREDMLMDCLKNIQYLDKDINFHELAAEEKQTLFNKLPINVIGAIKEFVEFNDEKIIVMDAKLNLPEMTINFFDNTSLELVKVLYSHYQYSEIPELLFMLSKRIGDVGYLNSRNPRDLELLIRLYSEEMEKLQLQDKS